MSELNLLEKTNRINLLFDFYGVLLTDKQQTFLQRYFHDDYSLGEIALEYKISRQAVYEHIKRAETMLLEYEYKLQLLAKYEARIELIGQMQQQLAELDPEQTTKIGSQLEQLRSID